MIERSRFVPVGLVILALLASTSALAEADGPDFWKVVGVAADEVLNIRGEAGPKAAKVGEIPPTAVCIKSFGCSGGLTLVQYMELSEADQAAAKKKNPRWCEIEYGGQRGWVAGRYLAEDDCVKPSGMAPWVDQ